MYIKKGKVIFGYKDTYSLHETLRPIICAGLEKFLEVITTSDNDFAQGVNYLVIQEAAELGLIESRNLIGSDDHDKVFDLWIQHIEKMIYAFGDNEPDVSRYTSNEKDRYKSDEKLHRKKVEEGLKLFVKYYECLWW